MSPLERATDNMRVVFLVHEAGDGGKSPIHDELIVTELTGAQLQFLCAGVNIGLILLVSFWA